MYLIGRQREQPSFFVVIIMIIIQIVIMIIILVIIKIIILIVIKTIIMIINLITVIIRLVMIIISQLGQNPNFNHCFFFIWRLTETNDKETSWVQNAQK